jgi:hypothetical protein
VSSTRANPRESFNNGLCFAKRKICLCCSVIVISKKDLNISQSKHDVVESERHLSASCKCSSKTRDSSFDCNSRIMQCHGSFFHGSTKVSLDVLVSLSLQDGDLATMGCGSCRAVVRMQVIRQEQQTCSEGRIACLDFFPLTAANLGIVACLPNSSYGSQDRPLSLLVVLL